LANNSTEKENNTENKTKDETENEAGYQTKSEGTVIDKSKQKSRKFNPFLQWKNVLSKITKKK